MNIASSNGALGKYKDMADASGKAISLWELGVRLGVKPTWEEVRQLCADLAGVVVPERTYRRGETKEPKSFDEQVEWCPPNPNTIHSWCENYKKGVTPKVLIDAGGRLCLWPKSLNLHRCIAIPATRGESPVGWVIYRTDGREFPPVESWGLKSRKVHCLQGSRPGWLIPGGWDRLVAADTIWIVEGPPDALSLASILPDGHAVVTGIFGASEKPESLPWEPFKGKTVHVVPQADEPGQAAAKRKGDAACRAGAQVVRVVKLPFEITKNHGKDVRDWINDGGGWVALNELVSASSPHTIEVEPISNFREEYDEAKNRTIRHAIPAHEVADNAISKLGDWPANLNGTMLVPGREPLTPTDQEAIWILDKPSKLFGWMKSKHPVKWSDAACENFSPLSEHQFFELLGKRCKRRYDGVSFLPHQPEVSGLYYVPWQLPPPNGEAAREFLDALNPETETDRMLLLAAMLTPGWGGPPGKRPIFLITSDHGRGAGKTETANAIAGIWGGSISFGFAKKRIEEFKSRLLDNSALPLRVVVADNLKGMISSAELEELVTCEVIDGKRMYFGDFRRPNYLTWFMTANTPASSSDIAARSVVIKIGKPRATNYSGWLSRWMEANRLHLIADLLGILKEASRSAVDDANQDRWRAWQEGVLEKLPDSNALAAHIIHERPSIDMDADEAEDVGAHLIEKISNLVRYNGRTVDLETNCYGVPVGKVYDLLRELWKDKVATDRSLRIRMNNLFGIGSMGIIHPDQARTYGRCFLFGNSKERCYPFSDEWRARNPGWSTGEF